MHLDPLTTQDVINRQLCKVAYMFGRISAVRYTCSLCRSRSSQVHQSERAVLQSTILHQRRQQSAVALRVENDVDEARSAKDPGINTQQQQPETSIQPRDGETSDTTDRRRAQKTYRRWRPHQAETLGIDVLGKPAEVLILPTRKRKIAQTAPSEEESGNKPDLRTSLDSESKPISMKDVLKNIDSLKEELGPDKQDFYMVEWKDRRKRLTDGFTKTQLEQYLRAGGGEENTKPQSTPSIGRVESKRDIATQIMVKLWEWRNKEVTEVIPETPQDVMPRSITRNINVTAAKLSYIMLHEKQRLGRLSETYGVQIDIFKKKQRIRVTGTTEAIENANSQVRRLTNSIKEQTLEIPTQLRNISEDSDRLTSVLTMLMRKHKLFIAKEKEKLNVVCIDKMGPDLVLRDLILMSGILHKHAPSSFFVEGETENLARVPFYHEESISSPLHDETWSRYVTESSHRQTDDKHALADSRKLRHLAEKFLRSVTHDKAKMAEYVIEPGSLTHEYTTNLGQILFTHENGVNTKGVSSSTDLAAKSSTVILRQALLPQALAKSNFVHIGPKNSPTTQHERVQPLFLNVRLQPSEHGTRYPPLHILLSGRDASLGLRQQLVVKRASAIVDYWQYNILLPNKPLDIVITKHSRIDLLGDSKSSLPNKYLGILRQLGSYLAKAQSPGQHELPPIWRIDVSTLLKGPNSDNATPSSSQSSENTSEDGVRKSTATNSKATYVLEPPETLDFTSFSSQLTGDSIDHIVCHTDSNDPPQQRQILRIGADPLSKVLHAEQSKEHARKLDTREWHKWLKHSVGAAYQIATMLQRAEHAASKSDEMTQTEEAVQ